MCKKQVEAYIDKALNALQDCGIVMDGGLIPNEFKGYTASFGASIVTNGLLPAITFFQGQGRAKEKRHLLMEAILYIIDSENVTKSKSIMDYVNKDGNDKDEVKEQIISAAVALKLTMRTFQFTDKEAKDDASA